MAGKSKRQSGSQTFAAPDSTRQPSTKIKVKKQKKKSRGK
jgi:hypothetical protein